MGEKKKPGRFTLQFNLDDPQQRTVSELLEQQGRHKAQFITSAVLLYIQCPKPQRSSGELPVIDEAVMERMLLAIMEKHPRFVRATPSDPPGAREAPTSVAFAKGSWEDFMEDDTLKAINDTLTAFRQG